MDVRVWGVVEDRLIELLAEPATSGGGIRILGLPDDRTRTTAQRLRAALVNSCLVREAPAVVIRLEPAVRAGATSELELALALAALAQVGAIPQGGRWIFASGRLGLDAAVLQRGEGPTLADVVESLCRTRGVR